MDSVQLHGYAPESNKKLNNITRKFTTASPEFLKNSPIRPSGPADFPGFSFLMACTISSLVIGPFKISNPSWHSTL